MTTLSCSCLSCWVFSPTSTVNSYNIFPENHWAILLFVGITSVLLLLWGGIATYMEAPDKLFLLVGEEEIKLHLKRQTGISLVFWLFVQTLFLAVICALIFSHGLWLACFSGLCAFYWG